MDLALNKIYIIIIILLLVMREMKCTWHVERTNEDRLPRITLSPGEWKEEERKTALETAI